MKHQELRDNIKGSILKRDYLGAFLMQSAYLEAVLKYIADYNFFKNLEPHPKNEEPNKFYEEIRNNFNRKSLFELTKFLQKTGVFDKALADKLNKYREKRNTILHDLIKEVISKKSEDELKETCGLGETIMEDSNFSEMIDVIERIYEKPEDPKSI